MADAAHEHVQQFRHRRAGGEPHTLRGIRVETQRLQRQPGAAGIGEYPFQAAEDIGRVEFEGEVEGRKRHGRRSGCDAKDVR